MVNAISMPERMSCVENKVAIIAINTGITLVSKKRRLSRRVKKYTDIFKMDSIVEKTRKKCIPVVRVIFKIPTRTNIHKGWYPLVRYNVLNEEILWMLMFSAIFR
jgi:hypothetical protein